MHMHEQMYMYACLIYCIRILCVHACGTVSLTHCTADIDQWNKVTQVLGTPPTEFFKQLQPSVRLYRVYSNRAQAKKYNFRAIFW